MPKIFPLVKKVTVVQGGDIPAGASVMSDSLSMFARVTLPESIAGQTDSIATAIAATYADSNVVPVEALTLGVQILDSVDGQSETAKVGVLIPDSLATALEAANISLQGFADSVAAQSETLKTGFSGFQDSSVAPTDSLSGIVSTWSNSAVGSGTAPTNPTNANGQNNGTLANCKAAGLPTVVASTLTLTIPRASVPNTGTYVFWAYYRTNAGVADTFTMTYAQTGGSPASSALATGNFLTNPASFSITSLHATNPITVTFTHTCTVAATGGSIDIDAVMVKTTGAF